jgi:hypothetical protein
MNIKRVETHGCIICGKLYDLLVVSDSQGRLVDFAVTTPGGVAIKGERPLVACESHTADQVKAALARRSGPNLEDLEED